MLTPSYIVVTRLQLLINLIHRNRNSKWSKNFEERLHHGGGKFFTEGQFNVTPTNRQHCSLLWHCDAIIDCD